MKCLPGEPLDASGRRPAATLAARPLGGSTAFCSALQGLPNGPPALTAPSGARRAISLAYRGDKHAGTSEEMQQL